MQPSANVTVHAWCMIGRVSFLSLLSSPAMALTDLADPNHILVTLEIVRFCAEEVERQRRGPLQVADMVGAWVHALRRLNRALFDDDVYPSLDLIKTWGLMVEPGVNHGYWRGVGMMVGLHVAPGPDEVPELMARWHARLSDMTPGEAYREFEVIHPFADGNGRVGKIIFNWLNSTLDSPIMPPNYFGDIDNP